jgi:prepilin-type N-terminal cleavage/methylation domain-containing protein
MLYTFFKKIKYNKSQKKGFTLIETLVAVFILTLALTGPIYIATLAIRSSVESRDNVSAYFLAEEAIEVVRNNRDNKSLQSDVSDANWLSDITGGADCINNAGDTSTVCVLTRDNTGYSFSQCVGTCPPLAFNPTGDIIYGDDSVSGSARSKFTREIYLQTADQDTGTGINAEKEINLVVTITWQDKGRDRRFQITERLHNQKYIKYTEV